MRKILELYAGIGGLSAAVSSEHEVVAAVEQSPVAALVYRRNFSSRLVEKNLIGLSSESLEAFGADLWWLSPPCQSFTRRGRKRDVADPRAGSFLHLIDVIGRVRPRAIALENVPEFRGSEAHRRFALLLEREGYHARERVLCPTELGVPNRRRRFYLVAALDGLPDWPKPVPRFAPPIGTYLDEDAPDDLEVPDEAVERYRWAIQVLDPKSTEPTNCFTAAYGRSWVKSGGYVEEEGCVRRFSEREILRLLGFPGSFSFPAGMPRLRSWSLLGNSLSVTAVKEVLRIFE